MVHSKDYIICAIFAVVRRMTRATGQLGFDLPCVQNDLTHILQFWGTCPGCGLKWLTRRSCVGDLFGPCPKTTKFQSLSGLCQKPPKGSPKKGVHALLLGRSIAVSWPRDRAELVQSVGEASITLVAATTCSFPRMRD